MPHNIERPELYSGDRVRITGGPYEGTDGYVYDVRWIDASNEYMVSVKIKVSWCDDPIKMPIQASWVQLL